MTLSIQDQKLLADFDARLNASVERVYHGKPKVQRDAQGNIVPSRRPNAVDMMVNRATGREDQ